MIGDHAVGGSVPIGEYERDRGSSASCAVHGTAGTESTMSVIPTGSGGGYACVNRSYPSTVYPANTSVRPSGATSGQSAPAPAVSWRLVAAPATENSNRSQLRP